MSSLLLPWVGACIQTCFIAIHLTAAVKLGGKEWVCLVFVWSYLTVIAIRMIKLEWFKIG